MVNGPCRAAHRSRVNLADAPESSVSARADSLSLHPLSTPTQTPAVVPLCTPLRKNKNKNTKYVLDMRGFQAPSKPLPSPFHIPSESTRYIMSLYTRSAYGEFMQDHYPLWCDTPFATTFASKFERKFSGKSGGRTPLPPRHPPPCQRGDSPPPTRATRPRARSPPAATPPAPAPMPYTPPPPMYTKYPAKMLACVEVLNGQDVSRCGGTQQRRLPGTLTDSRHRQPGTLSTL